MLGREEIDVYGIIRINYRRNSKQRYVIRYSFSDFNAINEDEEEFFEVEEIFSNVDGRWILMERRFFVMKTSKWQQITSKISLVVAGQLLFSRVS
ncbi:hypothetical protein GIB67_031059 [Kingdonia uniflora]|uniref:Uncharacterized protein n=1 Tax=Kingdonia uniflora TaxID=39325 RepID=A0A7J7ME41_9MAGN|nr:hypothetical protein GIB67_031059 [Kingdonia uniflora]